MPDTKNNPDQVYPKDNSQVVYPIGYAAKWEDLDDEPRAPVKLCRLEDPTCEACQ